LNFDIVFEAQEIYDRLSKVNPEQLENTVNIILNKLRNDYNHGKRTFIIDATPGDLNINFILIIRKVPITVIVPILLMQ